MAESKRLCVLVLADASLGHTERYVAELIRQGCEVALASLEVGNYPYIKLKRRGLLRPLHYPLAIQQLKQVASSFQPDIINPHFASGYGFLASMLKAASKRPVALHLLGSDILIAPQKSWYHRRKVKAALAAADIVFGDSHYLCDQAVKVMPLRNHEVIPWGIEEQYLQPSNCNKSFGAPLKVLVPRPHEPVYNNDFLLRHLQPLIIGDVVRVTFPAFGRYSRAFIDHARAWYGDRVEFYTKKSRDEFIRFMAGFDIYLSASKSDSSPVSLIEAMGLGLIPIVGDIPGVHEWMKPNRGLLFDLSQPLSLLSAFEKIKTGALDFEQMRTNNYEQVVKHGRFEKNISDTIEAFQRTVQEWRP